MGLLVIFYIMFPNKIAVINSIVYILISAFILSILKLLYHDPRPYFIFDDISGYGCDPGFGKPSGHSFMSINVYFVLIDGYLRKKF